MRLRSCFLRFFDHQFEKVEARVPASTVVFIAPIELGDNIVERPISVDVDGEVTLGVRLVLLGAFILLEAALLGDLVKEL